MTLHATFCKIISVLVIINLIGCTSLQTIEVTPDKLHEQIRHESLLKVGDKVRIVTENKKEYQFIVTVINEDEIRGYDITIPIYSNNEYENRGDDVTIPIDSIEAVETSQFSTGKTALLAGGISGFILLIIYAAGAVAAAGLVSGI